MKNTILILTVLVTVFLGLTSCKKHVPQNPTCLEAPPTNEMCQAYFQRWFYNQNTQQCQLIGYSGCSQKGFATEKDCEACKCK